MQEHSPAATRPFWGIRPTPPSSSAELYTHFFRVSGGLTHRLPTCCWLQRLHACVCVHAGMFSSLMLKPNLWPSTAHLVKAPTHPPIHPASQQRGIGSLSPEVGERLFFWLNTPLNLSVSLSLTKRMLRMLSSLKIWSMSPCTVLKGRFPTYAVKGGSDGSSFCFLGPPEVPAPGRGLERRKSSERDTSKKTCSFIMHRSATSQKTCFVFAAGAHWQRGDPGGSRLKLRLLDI